MVGERTEPRSWSVWLKRRYKVQQIDMTGRLMWREQDAKKKLEMVRDEACGLLPLEELHHRPTDKRVSKARNHENETYLMECGGCAVSLRIQAHWTRTILGQRITERRPTYIPLLNDEQIVNFTKWVYLPISLAAVISVSVVAWHVPLAASDI